MAAGVAGPLCVPLKTFLNQFQMIWLDRTRLVFLWRRGGECLSSSFRSSHHCSSPLLSFPFLLCSSPLLSYPSISSPSLILSSPLLSSFSSLLSAPLGSSPLLACSLLPSPKCRESYIISLSLKIICLTIFFCLGRFPGHCFLYVSGYHSLF